MVSMAMRSMASATISFGLVSIPVRLYSATESSANISFNLLHKECGSRLRQQYVCIKDEKIVPREDMIKGYEFQKGEYVTFSPEELKELEETSTQSVDITEFVPLEKVDPIYFERAYFLGPDKGGDRSYKLLARAMAETGRAALARYAARGKMYLVMLRPLDDKLVMQELHYADEVRSIKEVPVGDAEVREGELKLAKQLVEQIARETFNPDAYEDEVKKRIQEQTRSRGKIFKSRPRSRSRRRSSISWRRSRRAWPSRPPRRRRVRARPRVKMRSASRRARRPRERARRPRRRSAAASRPNARGTPSRIARCRRV
jgi:DNA end-binding protein Ku